MKDQTGLSAAKQTRLNREEKDAATEPTRADEYGDVAEPDAPTAAEENPGMNTILGVGPLSGIQNDAGDE
jgi:hypothetical protein